MGADQRHVDARGDERLERRIVRRLAEAVQSPAFQIRNARRKLKTKQRTQREDMIRIPAPIGVVADARDLALVIEQSVQDVQRLAGGRGDHLGVEGRMTIGDVRVELAAGLVPIVRVEARRIAAETASAEELSVGGRRGAAAELRRQGFALLLIDQAAQRGVVAWISTRAKEPLP